MTEPKPDWWFLGDSDASESDVQRQVVEALEAAGWEVLITSQDRSTRGQSRGLPDLLCWKHNHSLLIECKSVRGRLRGSQRRFKERIAPHEGPHLRYIVVKHVAMIEEWLAPGRGAWK